MCLLADLEYNDPWSEQTFIQFIIARVLVSGWITRLIAVYTPTDGRLKHYAPQRADNTNQVCMQGITGHTVY